MTSRLSLRIAVAATLMALLGAVRAQAPTPDTEAEVRKIDRPQARITLRHAEIKSLDMPPMTMVFRVQDARWLDGLAVGDKVRFAAAKLEGQYTVTAIVKQP